MDRITPDNQYTRMQYNAYQGTADLMVQQDHRFHDDNPDYRLRLLHAILDNPIDGKRDWSQARFLEFGCGTGRNMDNVLRETNVGRIDGVDISDNICTHARAQLDRKGHASGRWSVTKINGVDLQPLPDNTYDFAFSTIVLQHICVHRIRYQILQEIYRVLRPQGIFSFQMATDRTPKPQWAGYFEDRFDAPSTNGRADVSIQDPQSEIFADLRKIGFTIRQYHHASTWHDEGHDGWIFIECFK